MKNKNKPPSSYIYLKVLFWHEPSISRTKYALTKHAKYLGGTLDQ